MILATSYGFFAHSQLLLPDMLVVASATACVYAFWRAANEAPARGALVAFYAALAFGVFAKGPIGLLPLLVVVTWLWTEHGPRSLARLWSPAGIGIFAGVTLIWLVPLLAVGLRSFGESVLWQDWLRWYLGLPAPRRMAKFATDWLLGFLPWTFLAPLALGQAVRSKMTPALRFVLMSFAIPFLVIMLSQNRLPRYLLPTYPGAALLVAWWADAHGSARSTSAQILGWVSLVGICAALVARLTLSWLHEPEIRLVPGFSWEILPLIACALLIGGVFLWGLRTGGPALLIYGGAGIMVVALSYGGRLYDSWMNQTQNFKRVVASAKCYAEGGDVRVFASGRLLPLDFYYGRELVRINTVPELNDYLASPERPTALIGDRRWTLAQKEIAPDVRVLATLRVQDQDLLIVRRTTKAWTPCP